MIVERLKKLFKMGCRPSRESKSYVNPGKPGKKDVTKTDSSSGIGVMTVQKYDEIFVNVLFKDLKETPEMFILNNMLMNVQFFENYQRDILRIGHTEGIKLDNERNKILLKEQCMECISPDIIVDKVNKNIRFKPHHGPKKLFSEGMVIKRLYVINDHIDVLNAIENIPQYTSIDKPAYQVRIEESGRKGYVRLKFIDSTKIPKIYEPVEPLQSYSSPGSYDTDDYTSITELRTPKLLEILQGVNVRRDSLPKNYFAPRKVKRRLSASNLEGGYDYIDENILYEKVTYLDANAFMRDFEKSLFPHSIGEALGFDETEISRAKSIPGKVFCNMLDEDDPDSFIPCEVIPAVSIEWPAEQAFEFEMREDRPTITDRVTGMQYRWPTDEMIQEIKSLSCVLVPSGYYTKYNTQNSPNASLEWEIAFPKAERYIESRMSHTQLRCLFFLLAIHKTYIAPSTHQYGLLVEHIRHHMYWECEKDYRDWPEHRLGVKLKQVILRLSRNLAKAEMFDYFIKSKNFFANVPRNYLNFAQKVFHDIVHAPTMHLIKALRNIRYPTDRFIDNPKKAPDFYSSLEWKCLYDILLNNDGLAMLHSKPKDPVMLRQRKYADRDAQWEHLNHLKQKQERLRRKLAAKKIQDEEQKRKSTDSINTEWVCEKEFDVVKSKAILDFFISHFIKMTEVGTRISSKDQVLFYLKQAVYLTKILERLSPAFEEDVQDYRKTLEELENMVKRKVAVKKQSFETVSNAPPETPVRNNGAFDYTDGSSKKITVHRQASKHNETVRPIIVLSKHSSFQKTSTPKNFRKSISFMEPEK